MSTRVADRLEDWESQSFDGGFRELHALADREFSGVVRVGAAELYMTSGACVGVRQGSIDDFEGGSGTLYRAPSEALPLLAVMQGRADEVHAKYYSEETPVADVDRTLSDGGFTGYIELSENVLSGDYYLVYHAGESMSVAYVGESKQLLDGEEAFERADGEVGIYQVYKVGVDVVAIPEPASGLDGEAGASADDPAVGDETALDDTGRGEDSPTGGEPPDANAPEEGAAADGVDATTSPAGGATEQGEDAHPQSTDTAGASDRGGSRETGASSGPAGRTSEDTPTGRPDSHTDETRPGSATGTEPRPEQPDGQGGGAGTETGTNGTGGEAERSDTADAAGEQSPDSTPSGRADSAMTETARQTNADAGEHRTGKTRGDGSSKPTTRDPTAGVTEPQRSGSTSQREGAGETSAATDLEQRTVPSLDPERTVEQGEPPQPGSPAETHSEPAQGPEAGEAEPTADPDAAGDADRTEHVESELAEGERRLEKVESELAGVRDERDALEAEVAELRSERDDLTAEVERLQSELDRLEADVGAATDAEQRMSAGEALAGTDLFVRYHSKGDPTLGKAHSSGVRKETVNENLRIETHTAFDGANVAVSGQSFHEFLESTPEYQFVRWVVRELLFEIRSTGGEKGLGDLYDALPDVDRAELSGVVELTDTEGGQERRTEEAFDVILRDRMGNPLLAANLNDSREAATESMMEQLITAAERVGRSVDEFAAAFMVTQSFFEPGALETTSTATRGGLLSRDKRRSFVNLSRKRGYHLCLVEARNDNFHLTVPEL